MIDPSTHDTYVIAEAGVNHNGDKARALSLVDAAADAGADAVKFQTFRAAKLAGDSVAKAAYQKRTTDGEESQLAMLTRLELPYDWHEALQDRAAERGIAFISTAFDTASLDFLMDLGVPFFKVPSGELTNGPLLWRFARTGKPLVVSTGMATLSEVELALAIITHAFTAKTEPADLAEVWRSWADPERRASLEGLVSILHCTSQYPTPMEEVNLRSMDTLRDAFGLPVGYSDHTEGLLIPLVAVARGARVIEKHFTLDRGLPGPDHAASLEPDELAAMVRDIRAIAKSLGSAGKAPQPSEWDTRQAARQQVAAARDIKRGATFEREDLTTMRLGHGLPAAELWQLVGRAASRDYAAGDRIEA